MFTTASANISDGVSNTFISAFNEFKAVHGEASGQGTMNRAKSILITIVGLALALVVVGVVLPIGLGELDNVVPDHISELEPLVSMLIPIVVIIVVIAKFFDYL